MRRVSKGWFTTQTLDVTFTAEDEDDLGRVNEAIITITTVRKRYWLFGGIIQHTVKYRGSCTVWHDMGTGKRPGIDLEGVLISAWQLAKWELEDQSDRFVDYWPVGEKA